MNLIRNIIDKFKWASEGIIYGLRYDKSIQIQVTITIIVLVFSLLLKISSYDFIIILIMCTLVLVAEILNSSIEHLSNFICQKEYSVDIKRVKDLAAGAVLISAIAAFIVGIMIFSKYLF